MTLDNLLEALEKKGIPLELNNNRKIAVPRGTLTPILRQAIIAHKSELIRRLQAAFEVKSPQTTGTKLEMTITSGMSERKIPGAIRLNYAITLPDAASA